MAKAKTSTLTPSKKGVVKKVSTSKKTPGTSKKPLAKKEGPKAKRHPSHKDQTYVHLNTYINKVLKQVHPDTNINANAMIVMDLILNGVLRQLCEQISILYNIVPHKTAYPKHVTAAIQMAFTPTLSDHAISESTKAVLKFDATESKKTEKMMKSVRANIIFPPTRIENSTILMIPYTRRGSGFGVSLAATLEYVCAEILELAGIVARDNKKHRITPRHIFIAIAQDSELSVLLARCVQFGGVLPYIPEEYTRATNKKKRHSKKSKDGEAEDEEDDEADEDEADE